MEEFAVHLVDRQLRCHGFASLKGISYLRRNTELRNAVKTLVGERLVQGTLEQVQIDNGEVFIIEAGGLEQSLTRLSNRMLIISPFDNSVIQRERLSTLFQYDYKIECYVPAAKRKYGYFCLPLLYRGEFIGRMDCKAHRKTRHLEIKLLHFEPHNFDQDLLISAFVKAMKQFSQFQQCDTVSLIQAQPKHLTLALRGALKPFA
jgi:uncharacterized protein YcaQ